MGDQTRRESAVTLDFYEDLQHSGESSDARLKEIEPALSDLIPSIQESAQTLTASIAEYTRLSRELCKALTAYTDWLGITLEIPPEEIPRFNDVEKMFLSPQGHLVVVDKRGRVDSKALEEYPTEVVLTVVLNALPELKSKMDGYAQRLSERIDLLERISRELRSIPIYAEETTREDT